MNVQCSCIATHRVCEQRMETLGAVGHGGDLGTRDGVALQMPNCFSPLVPKSVQGPVLVVAMPTPCAITWFLHRALSVGFA